MVDGGTCGEFESRAMLHADDDTDRDDDVVVVVVVVVWLITIGGDHVA